MVELTILALKRPFTDSGVGSISSVPLVSREVAVSVLAGELNVIAAAYQPFSASLQLATLLGGSLC